MFWKIEFKKLKPKIEFGVPSKVIIQWLHDPLEALEEEGFQDCARHFTHFTSICEIKE